MVQASGTHHHTSQLGTTAVAPPGKLESLPPPAPALYHLDDKAPPNQARQRQVSEQNQNIGQTDDVVIAPLGGANGLPPPTPALHHLGDEHTSGSQVGPSAIAPPVGDIAHPAPIPAQYHLDEEETKSNQSPVKPFRYFSEPPNPSSLHRRPAPSDDRHTSQSQLGASAIAAPSNTATLPPPVPQLHHIKDDHTHETQLGKPAIAPPSEMVASPHNNNNNNNSDLTFPSLPPFPTDIPTAPLLRISLQRLLDQDSTEIDKVWKASQELGFFYLDLRDAVSTSGSSVSGPALEQDIDALFSLGEQLFALPVEEKQKYDFADQGSYYGYKGLGAGIVDAQGTRDRNEFYNVSKDDMLNISSAIPAPELLQKSSARDLLAGYIQRSHAIVTLLLGILNTKLGLPEGKLQSLHRLNAVSGDQVRWVNSPPQPEDDRKKALGEHTDFGTLTLLSNRLGGLQILPPPTLTFPTPQWTYVQPLRRHLIVNLGDALVRFTAGILRSNIHRVVNPPGAQANCKRMSLVYFARPEDEVLLKPLEGESSIIREASEKKGGGGQDREEVTAKEWILRRALGRRVGGDWKTSGGTEGGRA